MKHEQELEQLPNQKSYPLYVIPGTHVPESATRQVLVNSRKPLLYDAKGRPISFLGFRTHVGRDRETR